MNLIYIYFLNELLIKSFPEYLFSKRNNFSLFSKYFTQSYIFINVFITFFCPIKYKNINN